MHRGVRTGGLFALLLLGTLRVSAQLPEQISIDWRDDASCPRPLRLSLESEVARLLGPNAQRALPHAFEAHVERDDTQPTQPYRLTLEVRGEHHQAERQMNLASCAEAQDAAAVLIATAMDPDALIRTPTATPPKPPEPERPRPPPATPHPWSLVARVLFDVSSLPGASAGPSVGALFQRARLRGWAEARYLFARRAYEHDVVGPNVHADEDLFTVAGGGAYIWPFGEWVVGPALELELGALRAKGSSAGPTRALSGAVPWGAAELGGVAGWGVGRRVGLELSLFAGLPLWRPQLSIRDEGVFYTTKAATMRLAVAVRVSLGSP